MSYQGKVPSSPDAVVDDLAAPTLFFDMVPTCGGLGIIHATLACTRFVPRDGKIAEVPVIVAHLRCGRDTAIHLRDALTKALAMGRPPAGGEH